MKIHSIFYYCSGLLICCCKTGALKGAKCGQNKRRDEKKEERERSTFFVNEFCATKEVEEKRGSSMSRCTCHMSLVINGHFTIATNPDFFMNV